MRQPPRVFLYTNALALRPRLSPSQQGHLNRHVGLVRPTAEAEASRRERDIEAEARSRFRQQFVDCLEGMPEPANRKTDMAIGYRNDDDEIVGIAGFTYLAKGGSMALPRKYFGRIRNHYQTPDGMFAEVQINLLGESPDVIRKACRWVETKQKVDVMLGNGPAAGHIVKVRADGTIITARVQVTEPVAMRKVQYRVYSGAVVEFDEWFSRISLVDNDQLAKGRAKEECVIYKAAGVDPKAWKRAKGLSDINRKERLDNYRAILAGGDYQWQVAKQMAASSRYSRLECYDFALQKGAHPAARAPLTPAQSELAHVGDLIKAGAVSGRLATELAKRADDNLRIEQIKMAQRRPIWPGR